VRPILVVAKRRGKVDVGRRAARYSSRPFESEVAFLQTNMEIVSRTSERGAARATGIPGSSTTMRR
jgi:hypothetical protein